MKKRFALKSVCFNDPGEGQGNEVPAPDAPPAPEAGEAADVPAAEPAEAPVAM